MPRVERQVHGPLPLFTPPKRTFSSRPAEPSKRVAGCVRHSAGLTRSEPRIAPEYLAFLRPSLRTQIDCRLQRRPGRSPPTTPPAPLKPPSDFIDTITQLLPTRSGRAGSARLRSLRLLAPFQKLSRDPLLARNVSQITVGSLKIVVTTCGSRELSLSAMEENCYV